MNLPTEKLYNLGRHKMFKCWKWSSSDPMLVGFIIFIALFWSLMRGDLYTTGPLRFVYYRSVKIFGVIYRSASAKRLRTTALASLDY